MAMIEGVPIAKNQPRGVWVYHHAPDCAKMKDPTFGPLAYPDPERECTCDEAQSGQGASAPVGKTNPANPPLPSSAVLDTPQALREAVTTYTPAFWATLTDDQRYEEYIRVRALRSASAGSSPSSDPSALRQLLKRASLLLDHTCGDVEAAGECIDAALALVEASADPSALRARLVREYQERTHGHSHWTSASSAAWRDAAYELLLAEKVAAASVPPAEASAGDSLRGWQPIETAPKDGTPVLVWEPEACSTGWETTRVKIAVWFDVDDPDPPHDYRPGWRYATGEFRDDGAYLEEEPAYWMPLPQPPDPPAPREGLVPRVEAPPPSGEEDHRP
jgi:hypothetical protein